MTLAATFLGGARSRLLPASVPFAFFAAAVVFHLLAWLALFAGADEVATFSGGFGLPLAAIHLLTLGTFAMTAMGAAFQLLPVATRQPLHSVWPTRLAFWLLVPGVPLLAFGMTTGAPAPLWAGAIGATAGLATAGAVIADNLRRARDMPVVAAHGWIAIAALIGLTAAGIALIADFRGGFLADHQAVALAHVIVAAYGFMGFLALGFSHILLPMFALSPLPPVRPAWWSYGLAVAALLIATAAAFTADAHLLAAAALLGLAAVALHLWLMAWIVRKRLRKRLDLSLRVMHLAWILLPAGPLIGLMLATGIAVPGGATLFGFLLLGGWLLTFLTGVLQRIMPFLASMHTAKLAGKAPLVSELTAVGPLRIHAVCHAAALAVISAGIGLDQTTAIRAGAASGIAGALAFGWFAVRIVLRLRRAQAL